MIAFHGRMILLDIEGTVSPLAFVHEVMFPYARQHVAAFLEASGETEPVQKALNQMARDAGLGSLAEWCPLGSRVNEVVVNAAHDLMDRDVKTTGLKLLQGLIWEQGFLRGDLLTTLFEDVVPALAAWHEAGLGLRFYSSGSVHAQKLFFSHTQAGDLTPFFSGYYDTATGPKKSAGSYTAIAADAGLLPDQILFVSDVADELDAAKKAGMMTSLALRPGNPTVPATKHPQLTSFSQIHLA